MLNYLCIVIFVLHTIYHIKGLKGITSHDLDDSVIDINLNAIYADLNHNFIFIADSYIK